MLQDSSVPQFGTSSSIKLANIQACPKRNSPVKEPSTNLQYLNSNPPPSSPHNLRPSYQSPSKVTFWPVV